ncbi:MAG TPA: hypothetical protein PKB02_11880 [Anaerohalosphaeraceae bacterium]|nr:hypothetical protein [Anaerohalosphaeraceae bacterium]
MIELIRRTYQIYFVLVASAGIAPICFSEPEPIDQFYNIWDKLSEENSNWKDIHQQLSDLFDQYPHLNIGRSAELFGYLTVTVNAESAKSDSIEFLLHEWAQYPDLSCSLMFFKCWEENVSLPQYKIVLRGKDALPELIGLLDNHTIAAAKTKTFPMQDTIEIVQLNDLALRLLREIAGDHVWKIHTQRTLQDWWKTAKELDEKTFLMQAVFSREKGKITVVHRTPVCLIARKYPEQLLVLCEIFSKDAANDTQPFILSDALAGSSLPKDERIHILSEFAQRGSLEHKRCVLQSLAQLDDKIAGDLLLPLLETISKDGTGPYWTCPEASLTHVVLRLDNNFIWQKYLSIAKQSSVGLRMEMMNPMSCCCFEEKNKKHRIAFLAAFLDDSTLRQMSNNPKFDGPCAGFTFPVLEVRNFAAMGLSSLLYMDESPNQSWTEEQWHQLRMKIQQKIDSEELVTPQRE